MDRKRINEAAVNYYLTKAEKYETEFLNAVIPYVKMKSAITAARSSRWNVDDLYSILLEDSWRLLKLYVPIEEKEFHCLLVHQLNNKTINYINNTTERIYRQCFICGHRATNRSKKTCTKCEAPLKKPNLYTQKYSEIPSVQSHSPNYLKDIENSQMVSRVLEIMELKDPITHRILEMILAGHKKSEISLEMGNMAQNALNHRLRKCAKILKEIEMAKLATISKHLTFDSAHFLLNARHTREENITMFHKCCLYKEDGTDEPHGHTYHLEVFVTGFISERNGFVIDFKDLKRILKEGVVERLDHRLINEIPWFKDGTLTTVENIMHYIWEEIQPQIDGLRPNEAWLHSIKMYETPDSCATYTRKQWHQERLDEKTTKRVTREEFNKIMEEQNA